MPPRAGTVVGAAVAQPQKDFSFPNRKSNSPKELSLEEQQERRGKEMACEGSVKDKWEMMSNERHHRLQEEVRKVETSWVTQEGEKSAQDTQTT